MPQQYLPLFYLFSTTSIHTPSSPPPLYHTPPHIVGEFRRLAALAEQDGHLRQRLQQVLKLSKEKWEEARDHAFRAVVADNRMRIWYADNNTMELGLLFVCRLGNVDLDRPVGMWWWCVCVVCGGGGCDVVLF